MRTFWPFIIAGLSSGSLFGLAATGLVLTYKTSGLFNLAHGAIAAGAAYLFYELHYNHGWPWPIVGMLVVFGAAPLAGVIIERIARGLADVAPAAKIVATVGLLLAIQGLLTTIYGPSTINFPAFLPTSTFSVASVNVGYDQLIPAVLAAAGAGGMYAFFRFSHRGVAMRAVVDNPDLLDLGGTSPSRVRTEAWMIGSSFAAVSGVLLAPFLGLDAILLTLLVVQAFGAAAFGRFSSLPLTYLGGLVIGVAAALSTKYVVDVPALAGFPSSVPFFVLFGVLLFTRRGRLVEAAAKRRPIRDRQPIPLSWTRFGRVALVVAALAVPALVGTRLPVFINAAIFVLIFLSLRLLVLTSGQVSLCHAAFAAVGAASFSHLAHGAGLPWLVALVGAGLITVPVGAFVAIPAIRLSGLYLALATFGFGVLLERMAFSTFLMFGGTGSLRAPRPGIAGLDSDDGFYYVCLAAAVVASILVYALGRSRLGLLLQAMADSPTALATHGTSVTVTRVLVFCIAAFLAGVAGALFAALSGSISGVGFGYFQSLLWLTVMVIAGNAVFASPVLAAVLFAVLPTYVDNQNFTDLQPVMFGVLAMAVALSQGGRPSLFTQLRAAAERRGDRVAHSPVAERLA